MCGSVVDIQYAAAEIRREKKKKKNIEREMWASAQRDGCPAEYRWRPLFDAVKVGCPLLDYRAVTLPRRETR